MRKIQKGFSLIELLIVVAIILIIAAIAVPSLLRSRAKAQEASAVASIRFINTTCQAYQNAFGIGFPANLTDLGPSASPSSTAADLIDNVLSTGMKSGYSFAYTTPSAAGGNARETYDLTAVPQAGSAASRSFYSNESFVIRQSTAGTATAADPPIQ